MKLRRKPVYSWSATSRSRLCAGRSASHRTYIKSSVPDRRGSTKTALIQTQQWKDSRDKLLFLRLPSTCTSWGGAEWQSIKRKSAEPSLGRLCTQRSPNLHLSLPCKPHPASPQWQHHANHHLPAGMTAVCVCWRKRVCLHACVKCVCKTENGKERWCLFGILGEKRRSTFEDGAFWRNVGQVFYYVFSFSLQRTSVAKEVDSEI